MTGTALQHKPGAALSDTAFDARLLIRVRAFFIDMADAFTNTILAAEAVAARKPCPRPAKVVMPGDAGDCSANSIALTQPGLPDLPPLPEASCG